MIKFVFETFSRNPWCRTYSQQPTDSCCNHGYRSDQSTATAARRHTTIYVGTVERCGGKRSAAPQRATGARHIAVHETDTGAYWQRRGLAPGALPDYQRDSHPRGTSPEIGGRQCRARKRVSILYYVYSL